VSPKGGSGKTITAITLATILAGLGRKVVLVDVDASTNGLSLFYLDKITAAKRRDRAANPKLSGSFQVDDETDSVAIDLNSNISLVPSSYTLLQTEKTNIDEFRASLRELLVKLRETFGYIFLDAQAGADVFAEVAVQVADEIVIVSEYGSP
jgi:chromosome partitioning protein